MVCDCEGYEDDLFTPEVNSQAQGLPDGQDWTSDNAKTQQYDGYKVQAVLNEIDGFDHSRSDNVGMPALLGMNFQSVSTAQKLPTSGGQPGGYQADGTPGKLGQCLAEDEETSPWEPLHVFLG